MDGLSGGASVFAVVSLAIQLQESITKLIEFWKAVQNAPSSISALLGELKTVSAVLASSRPSNGDVELDGLAERVRQICEDKISLLRSKVADPARALTSSSRFKRNLGSIRIVLKQTEIESIQTDIERALSLLSTSKIISIENKLELCTSLLTSQGQQLRNISRHLERPRPAFNICQELRHTTTTQQMQLYFDDDGQEQYLPPAPVVTTDASVTHLDITTQKTIGPYVYEIETPGSTVQKPSPHTSKRILQRQAEMRSDKQTILWMFRRRTRTRRLTTTDLLDESNKETIEKDVDFFFCPPKLLASIGIARGLWMNSRESTGLSYSLQTFNAVPEDALVFEFCREGNLAGVRTLLKLGKASLRDRDPLGRTPLWIAAKSLQLEVAEFLLREGADAHARDWKGDNPPLWAIRESKEIDVTKKLSMIRLFQSYSPDGHDESKILHLMGLLMLFYRPRKKLPIGPKVQNLSILRAVKQLCTFFPVSEEDFRNILFGFLQFHYAGEVLHWTLGQMTGTRDIDQSLESQPSSAIHEAVGRKLLVRDWKSVCLIAGRTSDLHRFWTAQPKYTPVGTVMSIVLYQPGMFYPWVRVLQNLGCDLRAFVREELEREGSVVGGDGWDVEGLLKLCESGSQSEAWEGYVQEGEEKGWFFCERCGRSEMNSWTKVDLRWRRWIREFRRGGARTENRVTVGISKSFNDNAGADGGQTSVVEIGVVDVSISEEVGGSILPWRMVCSDRCADGVCVAWVFEDGMDEKVVWPEYPWRDPRVLEERECLTQKMPGAFMN